MPSIAKITVSDAVPIFSVITIVKNGQQFIEQTIVSVLGQSYKHVEYIVIDGGSTDGTVNIIKNYASKISIWVSEKDEGISDAFNRGLSFSSGNYVLFLNSDDALANSEILANVAENIVESAFPILIYGDCDVLDRRSGKILYRASIQLDKHGILCGQMLPHPALFAHRTYFEKYGIFDNNFKIAMDYEWFIRGGLREKIVHMPILVTCVRNGGISTLNQSRVVNEIIFALRKNKYMSSIWSEFTLRGYYSGRAFLKSILYGMGLYQIFFAMKNQPAKTDVDSSAKTRRNQE